MYCAFSFWAGFIRNKMQTSLYSAHENWNVEKRHALVVDFEHEARKENNNSQYSIEDIVWVGLMVGLNH